MKTKLALVVLLTAAVPVGCGSSETVAPPTATVPTAAPATVPSESPAAQPIPVPAETGAQPAVGKVTYTLHVEGMTWGEGCAIAVRDALKPVPGVKNVTVDLDAMTAVVEAEGVKADVLIAAVNAVDGGDRFKSTLQSSTP